MKITIKNKWNGRAVFECEAASLKEACEKAASSGAELRGAVLRGADNIPTILNIHTAVYEAASKEGALDMGSWHVCETTHCRAGWVIALSRAAGKAMEFCLGTPTAAALIYWASDPKLDKIPDFYASNEAALADMQRLAEAEKANVHL